MTKINLTIQELCDVVGGECSLDPSFLVKNIASLERANEQDLAVVFDPEDNSVFAPLSLEKIKKSTAGIFLASTKVVAEKNYVLVRDPLMAMQKLAEFIASRKCKMNNCRHETAIIEEFAVVEDNVSVGAHVVIEHDAKIGQGTVIMPHSFIGKNCQIGCNVLIHPGASILAGTIIGDNSIVHAGTVVGADGFGYRVMKTGLKKVPHIGIVRIGSHVEIGANVSIDRAEFEETVIEDGVKIDNGVHIAHNVHVGAHTAILAQTGVAGSVYIGMGCQIGGQVAIRDHVIIGNNVKIVSKSAIMENIKDGEIVCGIPSMPFSQWKRLMVAMMKLPKYIKTLKTVSKYIEQKRRKGFWRRLFRS